MRQPGRAPALMSGEPIRLQADCATSDSATGPSPLIALVRLLARQAAREWLDTVTHTKADAP